MIKNKLARWVNDKIVDDIGVTAVNKVGEAVDSMRASGAPSVAASLPFTMDALSSLSRVRNARVLWEVPWDEVGRVAKSAGKSAAIGAGVDAMFGLYKAGSFYYEGRIDKVTAIKVLANETAAGAVAGAGGTAVTLTLYLITGSYGTAALLGGMGGAIGARWLYRHFVPDPLAPVIAKEMEEQNKETEEELDELLDEVNDLMGSRNKEW